MAAPIVGTAAEHGEHASGGLRGLTLAALGVVYGDIGTSPLYTMREAFGHAGGLHLSEAAVLGVLSLVFWSLILIVTRQVRRAHPARRQPRRGRRAGARHPRRPGRRRPEPPPAGAGPRPLAGRAGPVLRRRPDHPRDLGARRHRGPGDRRTRRSSPTSCRSPSSCCSACFVLQSRGTASVGRLFGPVMLAWFATLGLLGLAQIVQSPRVLAALDPSYAVGLFRARRLAGLRRLGCDRARGHRGGGALRRHGPLRPQPDPPRLVRPRAARAGPQLFRPGRAAPARARRPSSTRSTTWPRAGLLWPLIGLATLATIIASQAVISGVFSLTGQAIQLGHLSRMTVAPHLGRRDRPDLHPARELAVDGRRAGAGRELRLLGQPRRRLRHLGHRRDGDRRRPGRPGRRLALGLGAGSPRWSSAASS